MADYVTPDKVAASLDAALEVNSDILALACTAVTDYIDGVCGRTFELTSSASRYYDPADRYCVQIHDAATVTAVATDDAGDGTYSTTWSASDYQLHPVGGVSAFGATGWPYTSIVAVSSRLFNRGINQRPSVKVTGTWGWTTVPDAVKQAALFLASEMFKAKEAPFGTAGLADFGPITIRGNRRVDQLLAPYKLSTASGGLFFVA